MKGSDMRKIVAKQDNRAPLTDAQRAQLNALEGRSPNTIDLPEAPAANWRHVRQFYKAKKEAISIRVDADVLDWLRRKSERYQAEINRILRKEMETELLR
jgi:uncharacterized protein (DUF4415 family)